MSEGDRQVQELGGLARGIDSARDDLDRLRTVVEHAVRVVSGCDWASIAVLHRGRLVTEVASEPAAADADALQAELAEGPTRHVLQHGQTVVVPDLQLEGRWPGWVARSLAALPVRGAVAVPMPYGRTSRAALTLYAGRPGALGPTDTARAGAVGETAGAVLGGAREVEQLTRALATRTVIGQAEGILMERLGLDADQAFGYLRRVSQDENVKLAAVAEDIVRTRRLPTSSSDDLDDNTDVSTDVSTDDSTGHDPRFRRGRTAPLDSSLALARQGPRWV